MNAAILILSVRMKGNFSDYYYCYVLNYYKSDSNALLTLKEKYKKITNYCYFHCGVYFRICCLDLQMNCEYGGSEFV